MSRASLIINAGNANSLSFSGEATLSGSGTVTLGGSGDVSALDGGGVLTNLNHTIQGGGQIGANELQVINETDGFIIANDPVSPLALDPPPGVPMINRGTIRAYFYPGTGGGLVLRDGHFDNTGGLIESTYNEAITFMDNVSITGGTLNGWSNEIQIPPGNTVSLADLTNQGTITIGDNSTLYLYGTIHNDFGDIEVLSAGSTTDIEIDTAVTLDGRGQITLGGSSDLNRIVDSNGSDGVLTNAYHYIRGKGQLGGNSLQVINQENGGIYADDDTGTLTLDPPPGVPMINRGGLLASSGGHLVLTSGSFDNIGGGIRALVDSTITLSGSASIIGGSISADEGSDLMVPENETVYLTDVRVNNLYLENGSDVYIAGTFTHGEIDVDSTGTVTELKFVDPVVVDSIYNDPINLLTPLSHIVAEDDGELEGSIAISGTGLVDTDCLHRYGWISPGNSVGSLRFSGNQTFELDNTWDIDLGAVAGTAGVDWDLIDVTGTLDLDGGPYTDTITIEPTTLNPGGDPGELAEFDILADYSWAVARADMINGFDPANFELEMAGFANPTDGKFIVWLVDDVKDEIVLNCLGGAMCPGSGSLVEGFGQQNDFSAVCDSDNVYWAAYGATLFFRVTDAVSQFELSATPPAAYAGGAIKVHLEASKESDDGILYIRPLLFNFTTGQYVSLPGIMPLTTTDKVQTFELPAGANPSEFIDPETDEVRVLIQTIQTLGLPNVRTKLDQVLINFD